MSILLDTTHGDIVIDVFIDQYSPEVQNFIKLCTIQYYSHLAFFSCTAEKRCTVGDPTYSGYGGQSVFNLLHDVEPSNQYASLFPTFKPTLPPISPSYFSSSDRPFPIVYANKQANGTIGSIITIELHPDEADKEQLVPLGIVVEGADVVDAITQNEDKTVYIKRIGILDDPFPSLGTKPDVEFTLAHHNDEIPISSSGDMGVDDAPVMLNAPQAPDLQRQDHLKQSDPHTTQDRKLQLSLDATRKNAIFISNLNPSTTETDLTTFFSRFGRVMHVHIVRERYPPHVVNPPREFLRSYAFLDFSTEMECNQAITNAKNVIIDGFNVNVDFCHNSSRRDASVIQHQKKRIRR